VVVRYRLFCGIRLIVVDWVILIVVTVVDYVVIGSLFGGVLAISLVVTICSATCFALRLFKICSIAVYSLLLLLFVRFYVVTFCDCRWSVTPLFVPVVEPLLLIVTLIYCCCSWVGLLMLLVHC
jgi:hypothetical protein